MIEYEWRHYGELSLPMFERILRLRQEVFMLEQNSLYLDIDGLDRAAQHLTACSNDALAGYLRLRSVDFNGATLGKIERVVVAEDYRATGMGRHLMAEAMARIKADSSNTGAKLSAQCYLLNFYRQMGFETLGTAYDDGGVLHQDMVLHW